MNETNGAIVSDLLRLLLLPQQDHVSIVKQVEASGVASPKRVEGIHDVILDYGPGLLVEAACESIGPWRLVVSAFRRSPPKSRPQ